MQGFDQSGRAFPARRMPARAALARESMFPPPLASLPSVSITSAAP